VIQDLAQVAGGLNRVGYGCIRSQEQGADTRLFRPGDIPTRIVADKDGICGAHLQ